jgi:hypothetical protein
MALRLYNEDTLSYTLRGGGDAHTITNVDKKNYMQWTIKAFDYIMLMASNAENQAFTPAAYIETNKPDWVVPFLPQLIEKLPLLGHDGLKRHALRMIERLPFAQNTEGLLLEIAFKWLSEPTESVAVKMYCMQILYRLSATEPDILQELYDTIEFQMADGTPGFRSIGSKMMANIDRDILGRKLR